MKKHKICIIGDGLSGLITAQILGQLDLEIDLISKPNSKKISIIELLRYHPAITNLFSKI